MNNEKFKLLIIGIFTFFISLIFIWAVVLGGPIPMLQIREFQASDSIPTFAESNEQKKNLNELWAGGSLIEDPTSGKLRSDVLSSLDQYRSEPCNDDFKEAYIEAVVEFIEDRMDRMDSRRTPSDSSEVIDVGGGQYLDSSLKFDEAALSAVIGSVGEGLLSKKDLPSKMGIIISAGEQDAGGAENIYKACDKS